MNQRPAPPPPNGQSPHTSAPQYQQHLQHHQQQHQPPHHPNHQQTPQGQQQRRDQNQYPPTNDPTSSSAQHRPPPHQAPLAHPQPPQPHRQAPSAPGQTSAAVPDRGTVKLAPHAERDVKPQQPAAYYDPNDPQRTVHVWNSVRKLPKELQQLQQHQQEQHQQQQSKQHQQQRPMQDEEGDPDVEGNAMLEGVILPAFDNVSPQSAFCPRPAYES